MGYNSHFVFLTFAMRFPLAKVDMHRCALAFTPDSFVIRVVGTTSWLRLPASTYKGRSEFIFPRARNVEEFRTAVKTRQSSVDR
jgi:hypothetical protein